MSTHECDLIIVGGGPAGLAASINAASEGIKVCLLDSAGRFGGQALESNAIENYPIPLGHAGSVTGPELMNGFAEQAAKFDTLMYTPVTAETLNRDDRNKRVIVTAGDYDEYVSKGVIIANGLTYRRLNVPGMGPFVGRSIHYGLPNALAYRGAKDVTVIGGANSAGQAALKLAEDPKRRVRILARSGLEKGMSTYLIERIAAARNIHVHSFEIAAVEQHGAGLSLAYTGPNLANDHTDALFIFIGAQPRTLWVRDTLMLDGERYIATGSAADARWWCPGQFATSMEGVWAVGDIRSGSVKRIASAIGEGAAVVPNVHAYLASL